MEHENGYLPKIAYHMATNNHASVDHFTERQIARYGELTCEDMVFISRTVHSFQRQWAQEEKEFNSHLSYI